jgi:subtilisin family serine protease
MFQRMVSLFWTMLVLLIGSGHASFAQTDPTLDFKPGEVIVGYRSDADRRESIRYFNKANQLITFNVLGGQKARKLEVSPFQDTSLLLKFDLPPSTNALAQNDSSFQRRLIDDLANQIKKVDPRAVYAYPNWLLRTSNQKGNFTVSEEDLKKKNFSLTAKGANTPNDPVFARGLQWHYQAPPIGMNAIGAWRLTTGDRRIVVAVVDTGLVQSNPDIIGSGNLLPGYNFVTVEGRGSDTSQDLISDGTHVAGIIGVVATNNNIGIAGINWAISVLPVRVLDRSGGGSHLDLVDGILWAAGFPVEGAPNNPFPADIINIGPFAHMPCDGLEAAPYRVAIDKARSAGSVIVASAGGSVRDVAGDISGYTPAGCPGVISVAAHDSQGRLTNDSNFGNVSIVAPGGDMTQRDKQGWPLGIWSTDAKGFSPYGGTGMAAAHVSGAIALAMAKHQEWKRHPDLIAAALHDSAVAMRAGACPKPCGPGQLDAQRLLEYVPPAIKPPAAAAISRPLQSSAISTAQQPKSDPETAPMQISGRWLMNQGEPLVIEKDEWFHPVKGTASIELRGKELAVKYPQQTGVKCSYQVMLLENGGALYLDPSNTLQPDDYCPSGRLAVGR